MGFVFNFITYGGHQVDGVAGSEEFATALQTGAACSRSLVSVTQDAADQIALSDAANAW